MHPIENNQELLDIIRAKLNLSSSAVTIKEPALKDIQIPIRVDAIIEEGNSRFYIEIKSKASVDTIAQLILLNTDFRQPFIFHKKLTIFSPNHLEG